MSVVGQSVPRKDAAAKVRGEALYLDDLSCAGLWHGVTVRSEHPSARIETIDRRALAGCDDVVCVLAQDLAGPKTIRMLTDDWPVLAEERVNHVGEAVALVAARTRERAREAARLIEVRYAPREPVLTLDDALRGDPRNGGEPLELAAVTIEHGDVDAVFAKARHVIEGTYETGHQEHAYLETHGAIAEPHEDGSLEIVASLQCPYYVHHALVDLFQESPERIRIRQAVTGGGFGGKEDYPDMIAAHAALLARACGRPVKIVYDRHEDIIATTKRHPSRVTHRTAVDDDGRLLAMDVDVLLDGGAYTTLSPVVLSRACLHAAGAYACENVRIRGRVLATNTATNGAFRGFGAPQTLFAVERHLDRIARELGLDPQTIRERNAYRLGDATPTGQVLRESVAARACLERACVATRFRETWQRNATERSSRAAAGLPLRGIGLSLFWHGSGFTGNGERRMLARAAVELVTPGRVRVLASSTDIGQGTETVFAQIVADALAIPFERVDVHVPDTAIVPDSGPTVASRTVMVVGRLLERAARALREKVYEHVSEELSFEEASFARLERNGPLRVERVFEPVPEDQGFDEATYRGDAYACYGWGANVVEVEVDPDTYEIRPVRVSVVCDVGRVVHPEACRGQVEGGTLQGIAWGYLEEMKLADGRYLNDRLQTYLIPTMADAPTIDVTLLEHPTTSGPFGAKGVGELPMDGPAPALVAAIENATGIVSSRVPTTPEHLVRLESERRRAERWEGDPAFRAHEDQVGAELAKLRAEAQRRRREEKGGGGGHGGA